MNDGGDIGRRTRMDRRAIGPVGAMTERPATLECGAASRSPPSSAATARPAARAVRAREIVLSDFDSLVDLLTAGYEIRDRGFWVRRLKRLAAYRGPAGFPKYGFLLESEGAPVGAVFTIFSLVTELAKPRCYLASWYVSPNYRSYAAFLASRAWQHREATYFNVTPTEAVRPILEAQGYIRYCDGRFVAVPTFTRGCERARFVRIARGEQETFDLPPHELELLLNHADLGCMSLVCLHADGALPFVFQPRVRSGFAPFARLIYCRDVSTLVRFAAPIGRYLIARGYPLVVLDANGPVDELIGRYSTNFPKYFKGPNRPQLGDAAYTSRIIFDY